MSPVPALPSSGLIGWWLAGARSLVNEAKRRWYVFVLLATVWALAGARLFVSPTPVLPILFNWTPSVPYHVVYVDYDAKSFERGDLIVYSFSGEAAKADYPGLSKQPFFKRVVGKAGDAITVVDRDVFVNGIAVGRAKTHTFDRRPLDPIEATVIPPGKLYVQGTSPNSFDSRYRSSGLVDIKDVVAKALPLL